MVADQELPFALKAPNAASRAAIAEANELIQTAARFASADALFEARKTAASKRTSLPRASDYTKAFLRIGSGCRMQVGMK